MIWQKHCEAAAEITSALTRKDAQFLNDDTKRNSDQNGTCEQENFSNDARSSKSLVDLFSVTSVEIPQKPNKAQKRRARKLKKHEAVKLAKEVF